MRHHPPDPDVEDLAPTVSAITDYDDEHLSTYLRILDAAAEDADWHEVARIVLHRDSLAEPERTWRAHETHLARARWMSSHGCRLLLKRAD